MVLVLLIEFGWNVVWACVCFCFLNVCFGFDRFGFDDCGLVVVCCDLFLICLVCELLLFCGVSWLFMVVIYCMVWFWWVLWFCVLFGSFCLCVFGLFVGVFGCGGVSIS